MQSMSIIVFMIGVLAVGSCLGKTEEKIPFLFYWMGSGSNGACVPLPEVGGDVIANAIAAEGEGKPFVYTDKNGQEWRLCGKAPEGESSAEPLGLLDVPQAR